MLVLLLAGCEAKQERPRPSSDLELAEVGKLRVGVYPDDPLIEPGGQSGNSAGPLHDLSVEIGRELASRLRIAFEAVAFESQPPVLAAVSAGSVDVMIINATPKRASVVDFSPDLLQTEQGFLVENGSPIAAIADVDRAHVRVGVSEGSTSQGLLAGLLKNASIIPVATIKQAVEMLSHGELDTFATNKAVLFALTDHLPGARVLDGRYGLEHLALAVPKNRPKTLAYMSMFVKEATANGFVERAAAQVRVRGRPDTSK
ncbi:MAG: transporter substrate-binding domain-containing protein [Vicinamibacterales bacterium]